MLNKEKSCHISRTKYLRSNKWFHVHFCWQSLLECAECLLVKTGHISCLLINVSCNKIKLHFMSDIPVLCSSSKSGLHCQCFVMEITYFQPHYSQYHADKHDNWNHLRWNRCRLLEQPIKLYYKIEKNCCLLCQTTVFTCVCTHCLQNLALNAGAWVEEWVECTLFCTQIWEAP